MSTTKPQPPRTEIRQEKVNCKYTFNEDELRMLGAELAEAQIALRAADDDRKRAMDEWKARISAKEAEITCLANKVSAGYEYRDLPCTVTLGHPPGKKTARRDDTGEVVWVRDLTQDEMQAVLPFEG
jgi:hypothetical protein